MAISEKQLEANCRNSQKGGVKTQEGKDAIKYNALKHGLLAKEVVITVGDGAENPEEFNALLEALRIQLNPVGTLEEMLTEKIAVAHWRLRRAYRYEAGAIEGEVDLAVRKHHRWAGDAETKSEEEKEKLKFQLRRTKKFVPSYKRIGWNIS